VSFESATATTPTVSRSYDFAVLWLTEEKTVELSRTSSDLRTPRGRSLSSSPFYSVFSTTFVYTGG
jgi:hypothetical protein